MSSYKFTPRAVASPDAPQKPLTRKRARSGGVKWVQVSHDEPGRKAKKPRTSRSQQPGCTHKQNQMVTSAEATAVAAQFLDRKVYPTKALQHGFLATCIDVYVENNVKRAHWRKKTRKSGPSSIAPCCASSNL
mmetsp:Transcript_46488/g.76212  ORF Transcript_46488/g.76212 Transcript_46488/m.76212 type:complete len:133 (-) Transcript_46488:61-459(-)